MAIRTNKTRTPNSFVDQALAVQAAAEGKVTAAQAALEADKAKLVAATPEGVNRVSDHDLTIMIKNTAVNLRPTLGRILDLRDAVRNAEKTLETAKRDLGRANGNLGRAKGLAAQARRCGGAFGKAPQFARAS